MPERDVKYKITTDSTQAENAFQRLEQKAVQLRDTIKSYVLQYGSLTAAIGFLKKSVDAYIQSEERNLKLKQILINTGNYNIEVYKDLIKWTNELQKEIGIEDDKIEDLARTLLGFGAPIEKIKELTKAVIDLSYFLGNDLQSTAILVGKAFEGATAGLSRLGIKITETNDKVQLADILIKEITNSYNDFTKTALSGTKGELEKLKSDFANFTEDVGNFVLMGLSGVYHTTLNFLYIIEDPILGFQKRLQDYYLGYSEIFSKHSKDAEASTLKMQYLDARARAFAMNIKEINKAIKFYENEIPKMPEGLGKKVYEVELKAYREVLYAKQTGNEIEKNLLSDVISKKRTEIEITELYYKLNQKNVEDLALAYQTYLSYLNKQLEKIKNSNTELETQRNILNEIYITQTKLIKLNEQNLKKAGEITSEYINQIADESFSENFPLLEDVEVIDTTFFDMLKNSFADTMSFIESEWHRVWRKNVGDANNLISVFFESLTGQFVSYLANFVLTAFILPFFGIPLHSGGIVKAHTGMLTRDEVPIIAKRGEMILTNQMQANLFAMLQKQPVGGNQIINVYIGDTQIYKTAIEPNLSNSLTKINKLIRR
jgi:hypothetical protein